jgi:hypothetical protein
MRKRYEVMFAVIGLIIFFSCLEGWGADWQLYATTRTGHGSYDAEGMTRQSNGIVQVWTKLMFSDEGKKDYVAGLGETFKDVTYTICFEELDCDGKRNRVLQITAYSKEGKVVSTSSYDRNPWKYIAPETVNQALFNAVCK